MLKIGFKFPGRPAIQISRACSVPWLFKGSKIKALERPFFSSSRSGQSSFSNSCARNLHSMDQNSGDGEPNTDGSQQCKLKYATTEETTSNCGSMSAVALAGDCAAEPPATTTTISTPGSPTHGNKVSIHVQRFTQCTHFWSCQTFFHHRAIVFQSYWDLRIRFSSLLFCSGDYCV